MTSRTPSGRSIHWATRTHGEQGHSVDRASAQCSGGHRFDSCRRLRFFLCPALVPRWPIYLSHFITELKIHNLYPLMHCVVVENIHTPSTVGLMIFPTPQTLWKIQLSKCWPLWLAHPLEFATTLVGLSMDIFWKLTCEFFKPSNNLEHLMHFCRAT